MNANQMPRPSVGAFFCLPYLYRISVALLCLLTGERRSKGHRTTSPVTEVSPYALAILLTGATPSLGPDQ